MPKKVRELKKRLQKASHVLLSGRGKGSHPFWTHPQMPDEPITIPGKDGDDAPKYLEKEIHRVLTKLEQRKIQEEEE